MLALKGSLDIVLLAGPQPADMERLPALRQHPQRTVENHLANIYGKLGVRSRTEAAVLAVQRGWIDAT